MPEQYKKANIKQPDEAEADSAGEQPGRNTPMSGEEEKDRLPLISPLPYMLCSHASKSPK